LGASVVVDAVVGHPVWSFIDGAGAAGAAKVGHRGERNPVCS
jgi:hypothetical protein